FYIADRDLTCLQPITGAGDMPESYTKQVDGFPIGTESLACGLAIADGRPALTGNVFEEPLWKPWLHLAKEYDFHAIASRSARLRCTSTRRVKLRRTTLNWRAW